MASDGGENEDRLDGSHEPRECMPCRGSGRVISNLGGTPSEIDCPWCGGGGVRVPGTDAQAKWPTPQASVTQADG
jgi:DnaJ-class molecular chaperone